MLLKPLLFSSTIYLIFHFGSCSTENEEKHWEKPEDILDLEQTAMIQMKKIWNITDVTYALYGANDEGRIKKFWNSFKRLLSVVTDQIHKMDSEIVLSKPASLLNKLFELQDLEKLREVTDINTTDPVINWKVQWIELSSLGTHIHWLFNKRIRDIQDNVPYIKTIAHSLPYYYGNPWRSKQAGNKDDANRYRMHFYPAWIEEGIFNTPDSRNLFYGLRTLIDECKTCKGAFSVIRYACTGPESLTPLSPVRMDAPTYVFFYLCLVDIKFYILINFFHIYREVYENIPYKDYTLYDTQLQSRIQKKLKAFSETFNDYFPYEKNETRAPKGFIRCDPPALSIQERTREHVYKKTFLKLTNVGTDFVIPERDLSPSKTCGSTCKELGRGDVAPCTKSNEECRDEVWPECVSNPSLCEAFQSPCPVSDLICYESASSAKVCPSTSPTRYMDWVFLNNSLIFPKAGNEPCSEPILDYTATTQLNPVTGKEDSCDICLCQCLEPVNMQGSNDSIRVFSQNEALSLIEENRILVGIKFEQVGTEIHLMVGDAVSLPGFKADMSTITWRKPTKSSSTNPDQELRIGRNLRGFELDDVVAPPGYVVTGVKLVRVTRTTLRTSSVEPYIGIKIRVTEVDSSTGTLIPSETKWLTSERPETKYIYEYSDPDEPTKANGPSIPDCATNQIVLFRATAISKTNVNEVIPYLDAQEVYFQDGESYALKGLGIYHKAKAGFGGFLGWKIIPH